MHDTFTDLLSRYRDGDLPEPERARVAAHLAQCEPCRSVLADLEQIVLHAGALQPLPPPRDLWAGIAARITAEDRAAAAVENAAATAYALHRRPAAEARAVRRGRWAITLPLPQLVAAAVVLIVLSAGAARLFDTRSRPGTPALAGDDGSAPVHLAAHVDRSYELSVAQLEQALDDARELLDPATVAVLEQSLAAIDAAIAEARAALDGDPANPFLTRHLDETMRRKVELLREASRAAAQT